MIVGAIAIFAVGSVIAGAATNMQMFVGGRFVQGIGGGGIIMLVHLVVSESVSSAQRGLSMRVLYMTVALGIGFGGSVGGAIAENGHWRWIFFLNLPPAGLSIVLLLFSLRGSSKERPDSSLVVQRIDYVGNALFVIFITATLFALTNGGSNYAWSDWHCVVPLVFGTLGLLAFIGYEASGACAAPMLPLRLFQDRTAATAYALSFVHAMLTIWVIYFLPVYFQGVLGFSSFEAGVQILPTVLVGIFVAAFSHKLLVFTGHYRIMHFAGFGLITLSLGLFVLLRSTSTARMWVIFQILFGVGAGLVASFLLPAIRIDPQTRDDPQAVSAWILIRNIGVMLGVAIPTVIFNNQANLFATSISDTQIQAKLMGSDAYKDATAAFLATLAPDTAVEVQKALARTLQPVWVGAAVIAGLAFLLVLLEADRPLHNGDAAMDVYPATLIKPDLEANNSRTASVSEEISPVQRAPIVNEKAETYLTPRVPHPIHIPFPTTTVSYPAMPRPNTGIPAHPDEHLDQHYASIPIMLSASTERSQIVSPISPISHSQAPSHVPTPPDHRSAHSAARAPWHRNNSWVPWSMLKTEVDRLGNSYGDDIIGDAASPVSRLDASPRRQHRISHSDIAMRMARLLGQMPKELDGNRRPESEESAADGSQLGHWDSRRQSRRESRRTSS